MKVLILILLRSNDGDDRVPRAHVPLLTGHFLRVLLFCADVRASHAPHVLGVHCY